MVSTYVYSYRLTTFGGVAPAYDNGLFSLAICKPDMRRVIGKRWHNEDKPNIRIIGINGKGLHKSNPYFAADYLLYIARVTDVVSFEEYFSDTENDRKDKIYIPWNGADEYDRLFGNEKKFIYNGGFDLEGTYIHNDNYLQDRDWDIRHNNCKKCVLLSDKFAFADRETSLDIKNKINSSNLAKGVGHKILVGTEDLHNFLTQEVLKHKNNGIDNLPEELRVIDKAYACK
jgi:hypothetical protein